MSELLLFEKIIKKIWNWF